MLKKIACLISALFLLSVPVFAADDFYVYGEDDPNFFCETLNMDSEEIDNYLKENNITYFACNKDNTKQIRQSQFSDEFSKKVKELSVLEDEEILSFSGLLSTFKTQNGTVVQNGDKKFLKIELETADSGGKYILTQFITVENSQKQVLTFYTADGVSRDYIDTVFAQRFEAQTDYEIYIIIGIVLFALAAAVITVFIIKELRTKE